MAKRGTIDDFKANVASDFARPNLFQVDLAFPSGIINNSDLVNTFRIGINKAQDLKWRWYLRNSRSISKREKGDKTPKKSCLFSKYTQK